MYKSECHSQLPDYNDLNLWKNAGVQFPNILSSHFTGNGGASHSPQLRSDILSIEIARYNGDIIINRKFERK